MDVADMVIFIYTLHTSLHFIFFQRNPTALTAIDDPLTESTILWIYLCIYLCVLCVHFYVLMY